jgi:solute carrier family 12 (potassium/chloride transporters), member 9
MILIDYKLYTNTITVLLFASYLINLITTLSISAIATNGTVRGGGAYYLISRSLGPEFGGSIGIVFYLGFVLNTGMNAVGLIDCIKQNFGTKSGNWAKVLPESFWWEYLFATCVLVICTAICLGGSALFARASNGLLLILLLATFSIPFSTLVRKPFVDEKIGTTFTGLSVDTFMGNLWPHFTKGAAGSLLKGRENYQDMFGILFPATGGIFASVLHPTYFLVMLIQVVEEQACPEISSIQVKLFPRVHYTGWLLRSLHTL